MLLVLLAGACERGPSAADKALADARDVALVEAAQEAAPPIVRLSPQPITFADIRNHEIFGPACTFRPEGTASAGFIALAMADAAYVKIDGTLRVHAADKGSAPLPLESWTHYDGKDWGMDLQTTGGGGTPSGDETTDWPGRLTIRDPYQRVVYSSAGTVQCGA